MQIQKTTLDGSSSGVAELAQLTNQEYLDAAIAASQEEDGFNVVLGINLCVPSDPRNVKQEFRAFVTPKGIVNHNFDLSTKRGT